MRQCTIIVSILAIFILLTGFMGFSIQEPDESQEAEASEEEAEKPEKWDTTLARGETREIAFDTSEGTFMSVDVSPDGEWIVFDLLAHVYRLPITGGEAQVLTQDSGVAVNYHPRYSPDGSTIAFISDRGGQDNLWLMDADGSNPREVVTDLDARHLTPVWSADGDYIFVRMRGIFQPGSPPKSGIWMFHKDGGKGIEMVKNDDESGASWPFTSEDGQYLYFHMREGSATAGGQRSALTGDMQLRRLDLASGEITRISSGTNQQQGRLSSGGAAAPAVSPDGNYVTFIRRMPEGTVSYKGQRFGPRTALWMRDLRDGSERLIMDPVEQDMIEAIKTLRVLPGYDFTPDGNSIVISQGGKIRRLDIASGDVTTIPFTAHVERTISEMAYTASRIDDEPFDVKFIRWYVGSPTSDLLAFQAVGKIWLQDGDAAPVRLTDDSFSPFEFSPSWSPDGNWIAFTTWDDGARGQLWKVASSGGTPELLSDTAGEYIHPDWSADGSTIVVARGAGVTARGRNMMNNAYWDVVTLSADGGVETVVGRVGGSLLGSRTQLPRPMFGPGGRIFFLVSPPDSEGGFFASGPLSQLVSVSTTPSLDEPQIHAIFDNADEVAISPDGKQIAFLEGDNIYLSPFPYMGAGGEPLNLKKSDKKAGLPVEQLTTTGGLYPNWRDNDRLEYGSSTTYYVHSRASGEATETSISLSVDRDIPEGSIAFTGARIVTMVGDQVLENATIVINGSRILCVGECDVRDVDNVVDAGGKTIIPGIVDMHAHHFREYNGILSSRQYESAIYLAFGVTTSLDNSMWSQNVFASSEMIRAGLMIGPRTFSTGDPLYNRNSPRQNLITSYEVAEQNIQRLKSWGAVSIKQYLQPKRDQRQWISDVARAEGLMVTAEGSDLAYNLGMIMDGQTAFENPMSYVPLYSDAAKFFGLADAVYSPTFIVGGGGAWNEEYFWQESSAWDDEKMRRWLPWRQLVPHARRPIKRPLTDYSFPMVAQGMADVIAEGGWGAIGSHGQEHGIGSHWEIWMAASAMGAHGALDVATRQGAHFLGALDDIGTLENGKLGDLLVLNSNPLDNIRNTTDIQYVMKGGVLYDAATLDQQWPNQEPFGDYYWSEPDMYRDDDRSTDYHDQ